MQNCGIASVVLLLVLTAIDNAYVMFVVYGLALIFGFIIMFRKIISKGVSVIIVVVGIFGMIYALFKLMR